MTKQKAVAEKLLQVGAVKLSPNNPFTWASGWKSPIYCDNRKVLSFPYVRDFIKSEMCNVIFEKFDGANMLAGVATAGIPSAFALDTISAILAAPSRTEYCVWQCKWLNWVIIYN
jgi:orotate phosphoribosyltransferase